MCSVNLPLPWKVTSTRNSACSILLACAFFFKTKFFTLGKLDCKAYSLYLTSYIFRYCKITSLIAQSVLALLVYK